MKQSEMRRVIVQRMIVGVSLGVMAVTVMAADNVVTVFGNVQSRAMKLRDGTVYQVVMDERGKDFCRTMRRENVEIRGIVTKKDGKTWIQVLSYVDPRMEAAHELWRRMRCNACAFQAAAMNAPAPRQLHGATAVAGRYYSYRDRIVAWERRGDRLWVATDNRVDELDLTAKRMARTWGKTDGLADARPLQLVATADTLWVLQRGAVCAVDLGTGKVARVPELEPALARACRYENRILVVADTGTYVLDGSSKPAVRPALPTGKRITQRIAAGIWAPDWDRLTRHLIVGPVAFSDVAFVQSYGTIYALDDEKWTKMGPGAELQSDGINAWYAEPDAVVCLRRGGLKGGGLGKGEHPLPDEIKGGRIAALSVAKGVVWVAVEPPEDGSAPKAGGIARLDVDTGKWQAWKAVDGHPLNHASCFAADGDGMLVVARRGVHTTKTAHPGMTYVKRKTFQTTGFSLHRFDKDGTWTSTGLQYPKIGRRMICGQDCTRQDDDIFPHTVTDMLVTSTRLWAVQHLMAGKFFSGYWPSVSLVAERADGKSSWTACFEHKPGQLGLQGEQPLVLNISNKGEMILPAVGHDDVLGLFGHGDTAWAVTEGAVSLFEADGGWSRIWAADYRHYWRATAVHDDGKTATIGSDRGIVSQLDLETGRFRILGGLKNRAIGRIWKNKDGHIVAMSRQAPLGQLPVFLGEGLDLLDAEAGVFDGRQWRAADVRPPVEDPGWSIRKMPRPKNRRTRDRSMGNYLFGPREHMKYYLKEVYWPAVIGVNDDLGRVWLGTYTGLLRLDLSEAKGGR